MQEEIQVSFCVSLLINAIAIIGASVARPPLGSTFLYIYMYVYGVVGILNTGVIKFWASRRYGDPCPQIYVVLGTGVPISTVDMGTPLKFWGPHVTTSTRRQSPMSTA